jgi:ABC-type multidrug transport system ATPase subunit
MEPAPALVAHGVARRYGALAALEPTDLELRPGELVVLVGPNGAGKSTLLALLAGALPPSEGRVVTELPPGAIGWAPQRPALYRRLSARENLVLFSRLGGGAEPERAAARLLDEFELPDDGRPAAQLSVGNQQRLNLALAFLGAPRLLLLDEPTASLDPPQARALWDRLERARADGTGAVVATHLLDEAGGADRVLALSAGRVAFAGTPAEYREEAGP